MPPPTQYTLSNDLSATDDPFIIEPWVSVISHHQIPSRPPPVETTTDDDDDILRPFINIFRLDPFSTHDGVHGRPVPSATPVHYTRTQTRPVMLEFQLDVPGYAADLDTVSGSPESAEGYRQSSNEEHNALGTSSPRRLLYPSHSPTLFPSSADTIAPNSDEDRYSSPRLLYPGSDHGTDHEFSSTVWTPPALCLPTEPPFPRVVVRSPQHVFQPLAQRAPVSDNELQRSPMHIYPTSMAYNTEYAASGNGSGSYTGSSESPVGGHRSWAAEHPTDQAHIQTSPQPTTNGCLPLVSVEQTHRGSSYPSHHHQAQTLSQPQPFFSSHPNDNSFSESNFLRHSPPQSQTGSHFASYGVEIGPQPPLTVLHERSTSVFPERFSYDRGSKAVSPFPRYLSKSRFASLSPSPDPSGLSPAANSGRSPSFSPTPSVQSDHSTWLENSRNKRRLDLAPYIPGAARKLYGKAKDHTCQVCKKAFKRPSTLQTHMNTHTGEKPYFCPVISCGRRFGVSSNLTRHLRTHGMDGGIPRGPRNKANKSLGNERESVPDRRNAAAETWIPESLRGMRNAKLLSHRPPFRMLENAAPLVVPLPPVRPRGRPGDENHEERDSFFYPEDSQDLHPYHPESWKVRPTLPGPLPSQKDRERYAADRARVSLYGFGGGNAQFGGWFGAHDDRA